MTPHRCLWPVLFVLLLAACADLTAPTRREGPSAAPPEPPAAPSAPAREQRDRPGPSAQRADQDRVSASHILIAYEGARRARATRSKEDARKLAEQVLAQARGGSDFAELARKPSDDPGSGPRGGALGTFGRPGMMKPFADAAFALKPGELSGVVETPFGFHIIKRTE
jgi:NIMA-interacting peptidyl-prolyl cis-trans isomerase 1